MSTKFNIYDHVKRLTVSSRFIKGNIPFDEVLKMCRQQLAQHIQHIPPEFITIETNDCDYKYNYIPNSTTTVDMFVITEEMFNNIRNYSSMMVDLERREEEVRKKEKEFKKLKSELKHINELSKNVNQLFKGL